VVLREKGPVLHVSYAIVEYFGLVKIPHLVPLVQLAIGLNYCSLQFVIAGISAFN